MPEASITTALGKPPSVKGDPDVGVRTPVLLMVYFLSRIL